MIAIYCSVKGRLVGVLPSTNEMGRKNNSETTVIKMPVSKA